jgi:tetratricopeptide (TPR) repeat protein
LFESSLDFIRANQEYERALALEPGNARLLRNYSWFAVLMGQTEAGLAAAHRAVALDPLNSDNHYSLGAALVLARRPREAIPVFTDAKALTPNDVMSSWLGAAYRALGDFQSARAALESIRAADTSNKLFALAVTYDKLGRHADAETMLAQFRALRGDAAAVFYSEIYAQWGDTTRALGWLETAMRQQDPYLEYVKMNPLFDPLRKEPRFQAVEQALKFPN